MGSGKTTVAGLLEQRGYVVIDADREAKGVMERSAEIRARLADAFGAGVLADDSIDFPALGAKVFERFENLRTLNAIVHPPLLDYLAAILESHSEQKVVLDAALLPLWNNESWFHRLWWVDCDRDTRLRRVCAKTGLPEEAVRRRMDMQERLFAPPPSPPWTYVANTGNHSQLQATIEQLLST